MGRFRDKSIDMGVLAGDAVRTEINSVSSERKDWKFDYSNSNMIITRREKRN